MLSALTRETAARLKRACFKESRCALGAGGVGVPPGQCGEVSVDRNNATETQTLKSGREGRKTGREPKETTKNHRNPQKLRDPGPTYEVSVAKPLP